MGQSLRPLLENPSSRVRSGALTHYEFGYSLRTNRYRYMLWDDGGIELYDHATDPVEMINLAKSASSAELLQQLHEQILIRITEAETPARGPRFIPPRPNDRGGPIDHPQFDPLPPPRIKRSPSLSISPLPLRQLSPPFTVSSVTRSCCGSDGPHPPAITGRNPASVKSWATNSRLSPWISICPSLTVPPAPHDFCIFFAS